MNLEELVARESIRELVASYTHHGDGGRLDALTGLFAEDGELIASGETYSGHDRITQFFSGIVSGTSSAVKRSFIRHYISNLTIDVTGPDDATGAAYWTVISDVGLESSGRYRDTYRRIDGQWRFVTRKIGIDRSKL